jgi:hypothetical protein
LWEEVDYSRDWKEWQLVSNGLLHNTLVTIIKENVSL